MQYLYFVSGQAGSSVHETLCLLRDIYRLQASLLFIIAQMGMTAQSRASGGLIPPHWLHPLLPTPRPWPYKMVYLYKPAYEREKQLREAGIPFPVALRHILCDLYAFRGWEGQADLILHGTFAAGAAMRLAEYILQSEGYAEETIW